MKPHSPAVHACLLAGLLLAFASCPAPCETTIVNGQTTSLWPGVGAVLIGLDGGGLATCTGSAITPRWVLTAAHCVDPALLGPSATFQFAVGPDFTAPGASLYAVDQTVFDPRYDPNDPASGHDFGLLHIKDVDLPVLPLKLNSQPLLDVVGQHAYIMGYGLTSGSAIDPDGLKRIGSTQVSAVDAILLTFSVSPSVTCEGDSGGPAFVYDSDGFPVIVGTTSFGDTQCDTFGSDDRVDAGLAFVASIVGPGICLDGQSCDGVFRSGLEAPLDATRMLGGCYVSASATGANNGTSWQNAYTNLQTALGNAACKVVLVAEGVYKPTALADRTIAFHIAPGMHVLGGYPASGSGARDPAAHPAILSGDIDNNDANANGIVTIWSNIAGANSYHVVRIDAGAGSDTVLDGLAITAGSASSDTTPDDRGGGIYCDGTGTGQTCSPTLSNVVLAGNFAVNFGGGLYLDGTSGGNSSPVVTSSTFFGNYAGNGGGAYNDGSAGTSSPAYGNDTFYGNSANYGGALYNHIENGTGTITLANVTFSGNASFTDGNAIAEFSPLGTPTFTLTNTILWGDTGGPNELVLINDTPTFTNSVVMGSGGSGAWNASFGTNGGGNVDADPMLGSLQDNGGFTPTLLPAAGSSAIDAGSDVACSAAPIGGLDQRGVYRPQGAHCDIGAVEVEP